MKSPLSLLFIQYQTNLANGVVNNENLLEEINLAANQLPPELVQLPAVMLQIFKMQDDCARNKANAIAYQIYSEELKKLHENSIEIWNSIRMLGENILTTHIDVKRTQNLCDEIDQLLINQTHLLNESAIVKQKLNTYSINIKEFATQQANSYDREINKESQLLQMRDTLIDLDNEANFTEKFAQKEQETTASFKRMFTHQFKEQLFSHLAQSDQILAQLKDLRENQINYQREIAEINSDTKQTKPTASSKNPFLFLWNKIVALFKSKAPATKKSNSAIKESTARMSKDMRAENEANHFTDIDLHEDSVANKQANSHQSLKGQSQFFASPQQKPSKPNKPSTFKFTIFAKIRNCFKKQTPKSPITEGKNFSIRS